MTETTRLRKERKAITTSVGCALALLLTMGAVDVQAQQPAASASNAAGPGWYGYVPGSGWVYYSPSSVPVPATSAAAPLPPGTTPLPGWAGYSPATGWTGYAPASSPFLPAVRPRRLVAAAPDEPHRYAANLAINRIAPQYADLAYWYREYGTGRNVPLAKPWLPSSP